ncbi:MAG: glycosyltransferase family 2 protein [Leptolyngbya sp.]|nr:MAG: glycosyltransferase family 2 protein [Leptolyngbya sp.]
MLTNPSSVELAHSVFIIIPVHNRRAVTIQCLAHLQTQGDLDTYNTIVVDDASTDGTAEVITTQYPSITILQGSGQLWWTGAITMGMRHAYQQGATHLIWLNDDCLVPQGTFKNLVRFVDKHPDTIVGAQGYSDIDQTRLAFGGKHPQRWHYKLFRCPRGETAPCDMLSGNLVCIPRAVVDTIGLPDTRLPHYGGDTLYLIQARQAGFRLFVDARTAPIDVPGQSAVYPQSWMLQGGAPFKVMSLIFKPQSMLSWRVWWVLLIKDYGIFGAFIFLGKYCQMLFRLALITGLRFLPLPVRQKLMLLKQSALSKPDIG